MVPKGTLFLEPVSVHWHGKRDCRYAQVQDRQEKVILSSLGMMEVTSQEEDAPLLSLEMVEKEKEPRIT